ncbi:hypothetical protein ACHHYP_04878 [Achlya hypogyna]|uniref:Spc7 kinetochore protein domain-containing protein n=1 Tax=Achlya hypogyna TaxID=1202772 RepID=A0A1V9ZP14_ACHHY|nr:hypothetical protein ACHHYP_04878 [Achlya hypogyna]
MEPREVDTRNSEAEEGNVAKRPRPDDDVEPTSFTSMRKRRGYRYSIANEFEREISAASTAVLVSSQESHERRETLSPTELLELRSAGRRETLSPRAFQTLESMMHQSTEGDEADMLTGMHSNLAPPLHVIAEVSPEKADRRSTLEPAQVATLFQGTSNRRETLDPSEMLQLDEPPAHRTSLAPNGIPRPPRAKDRRATLDPKAMPRSIPGRRNTLDPKDMSTLAQPGSATDIRPSDRRATLDQSNLVLHDNSPAKDDRRSTLDPSSMALLEASPVRVLSREDRRTTLDPSSMQLLTASPVAESADRRATLDPADSMSLLRLDDRRQTLESAAAGDSSDDDASLRPPPTPEPKDLSFHMGDYSIVGSERFADSSDEEEAKDDPAGRGAVPVTQDDPIDVAPMFASPPLKRTLATPLKSCLSARKPKNATPTKTISFGSPRGAEFRVNDPSTAMTPMCDRTAKAMFPLEKPEEDEDEETSVNSSILDEADQFLDDDHSTSYSFGPMRSPRRGSPRSKKLPIIGVSPLDNMTEARRKRRASFGAKDIVPPSRRQSLLGVNVMADDSNAFVAGSAKKRKPQGRSPPQTAFVDSSSEDEDIDITGEYITLPPPVVVASNGLEDLLSEDLLAEPASRVEEAANDDGDPTLDLGPVGALASDPSLFSQDASFVPSSMETLAPILEESDAASSRMDLSSDDDDDMEDDDEGYLKRRRSLVINLGDKFERSGSSAKKKMAAVASPDAIRPSALDLSTGSLDSSVDDVSMDDEPAPSQVPDVTLEALFGELDVGALDASVDATLQQAPTVALTRVSSYEATAMATFAAAKNELTAFVDELRGVMAGAAANPLPTYLAATYHSRRLPPHLGSFYELKASHVLGGWFEWRRKLEDARAAALAPLVATTAEALARLTSVGATLGLKEAQEAETVRGLLGQEHATLRALESIEEQQVVRAEYAGRIANLARQVDGLARTLAQHEQQKAVLASRHANATTEVAPATVATQLAATRAAQETYALAASVGRWKCLSVAAAALALELQCTAWNATVTIALDVDLTATVPAAAFVLRPTEGLPHLAAMAQRVLFDVTALNNLAMRTLRSHADVPELLQAAEVELLRAVRVWKEVQTLQTDHSVELSDRAAFTVRFVSQRKKILFHVSWTLTPHVFFEQLQFKLDTTTGLTKAQELAILDRLQTVPRGFRRLRHLCQCVERYLDDL